MLTDLRVRVLVVLVAAYVDLLGAPTALRTVLTAAAVAVTVESTVRHGRHLTGLDRVAVATATVIMAAIGLGFVLSAVPHGLTRQSWAVGFGVCALLAVVRRRPVAPGAGGSGSSLAWRALPWRQVVWIAAAVAVVAVALVVSTRSMRVSDRAPLQLSATQDSGGRATVVLSSRGVDGPFDVIAQSGPDETAVATGVMVRPGHALSFSVPASADGTTTVLLQDGVTHVSVRTLQLHP